LGKLGKSTEPFDIDFVTKTGIREGNLERILSTSVADTL
jgi:hypothetical protein